MKTSLKIESLVGLWVCLVLFFPYFPGVLPGYLGSNLALVASSLIPIVYYSYWRKGLPRRSVVYFALFFLMYFLVSIVVATYHDAVGTASVASLDAVVELVRPPIIFLIFIFWVGFFYSDGGRDVWFSSLYMKLAIVVSLLCFFEVYGGGVAQTIMYLVYKRDYKEIISNKATGVFGITYYLSFFLLYPFILSFVKFLVSFKVRYALVAMIILVAAFISQSRTGIFAYILASSLSIMIVTFYSGRKGVVTGLVVAPLVFLCFSFLYLNIDSVLEDFTYLNAGVRFVLDGNVDLSGQEAGSANIRISQIHYALSNMKWLGLVGSGMAKDGTILLESVYALYLYRYGIIGLLMFLTIVMVSFYKSFVKLRAARKFSDRERVAVYTSLACYFAVVPLALFSSAMQDAPKISLFYYGLVALAVVGKVDFKVSTVGKV